MKTWRKNMEWFFIFKALGTPGEDEIIFLYKSTYKVEDCIAISSS